MMLKTIYLIFLGLASGCMVAAGTFAFIAAIGIVPRMAKRTETQRFTDENTFVIFVRDVPVEGRLDRISGNSYNLSLHSSQVRIPAAYSNQKAYLQKDGNRMTLTVDVKQLIGLVSAVADNADNATFKMAMRLTRQYDNVCLGFHFKRAEHPGK